MPSTGQKYPPRLRKTLVPLRSRQGHGLQRAMAACHLQGALKEMVAMQVPLGRYHTVTLGPFCYGFSCGHGCATPGLGPCCCIAQLGDPDGPTYQFHYEGCSAGGSDCCNARPPFIMSLTCSPAAAPASGLLCIHCVHVKYWQCTWCNTCVPSCNSKMGMTEAGMGHLYTLPRAQDSSLWIVSGSITAACLCCGSQRGALQQCCRPDAWGPNCLSPDPQAALPAHGSLLWDA